MQTELDRFFDIWNRETENTLKVLRALPHDKYDFRPDPGGRSLGELAWHLAEGDAYMSQGIELGHFGMDVPPPNIQRPRTITELVPGFERVHSDAVARIKKLTDADLDRALLQLPIRAILWDMIIIHAVHHRGQLTLMCRLAGGAAPGVYGPNREEMAAMAAQAKK